MTMITLRILLMKCEHCDNRMTWVGQQHHFKGLIWFFRHEYVDRSFQARVWKYNT